MKRYGTTVTEFLCVALCVACCTPLASAQWVKAPSADVLKRTRGLIHETFPSASMNTDVGYSIVLPPGYGNGEKRYPVVYSLHGGGGNECSSLFTAQSWEKLYKTTDTREVILVYPNGFRSGYMDHHDGSIMIESMIIKELIPRIDERYRTITSAAGRAAHGFSMGSSGALKFAVKYPDMFCAAVEYGGGAIDLDNTKMSFTLKILEKNLASDPKLIQQNNTYHFLKRNHEVVRRNQIEFLLICGEDDSWKESAVTFQAALVAENIPCPLTLVPGVGHDIRMLTEAEGMTAARFQDRIFRRTLE